jgi:replication factor C small subunit
MKKLISNNLWVEKYRPEDLDTYVSSDEFKSTFETYMANGEIPHLLLHSNKPGTGKTTLSKILAASIDCDSLYINASSENNVELIRTKITNFVSSVGFKKWKIVILDEFDYMTIQAQAALRNLMETFSKNSRFILTCNYIERVIEPIQSRCTVFHVLPPSMAEVAKRCSVILDSESIEYDRKDLVDIIKKNHPDLRRIINILQTNSLTGKLELSSQNLIEVNYMDEILTELKGNNDIKTTFTNIRKIITNSKVRSFDDLYRFLYDKLEEYGNGKIGSIIIIIAEAMRHDALVVDKEINVMSMFVSLLNEIKS